MRKEPGVEVELVDGDHSELTVMMAGRVLAKKDAASMPSADQVLAAVRTSEPATVG